MEHPVYDENADNTNLDQVHEGMPVCDQAGGKIGKVRQVFLGAIADRTRGTGPATASSSGPRDDTLVDQIAEIFGGKELPGVLRDRLLRQGFIQIDTSGLFAADRFATGDQVEAVTNDCVRLRVRTDELIAR